MHSITSRSNPLIKHVTSLQQKKYRLLHGQFCAEGERTCSTLIAAGLEPLHAFSTTAMLPTIQPLVDSNRIVELPLHVMEKISSSTTPSGLLCQFTIPISPEPTQLSVPGIVLVNLADSGNMGTLIRTAAAFNCNSVVLVEGADPWSPKVVQASAGTIGIVSLFEWSWQELIQHKKNYPLFALVVSGGNKPSALSRNALLAIGSEAHGIPDEWLTQCDATVTLPMPGNVESLNAAVAGSIALYLAYHN